MPIPQPIDYQLAGVRCLADGVVNSLGILYHCGGDGRRQREQLQEFANACVIAINEIIASRDPQS
jgi:hypothetical protein